MSTTLMYDSVTVKNEPKNALIVAGYIDGYYKNFAEVQARYPHANTVSIDVNGSAPQAMVRDWETGDKGGNLEHWVMDHNKLYGKKDAVIYCNRATIAEVRKLTGSQILNKDYFLWIATGDGTLYGPNNLTGVIACQYSWTAGYDVSQVWPSSAVWWTSTVPSPPAPPVHPPAPKPPVLPKNWIYPPVRNLKVVNVGKSTVKLSWDSPEVPAHEPALPALHEYEVAMSDGSSLKGPGDKGYPRETVKTGSHTVWDGGSLGKGQHTAAVRAVGPDNTHASPWMTVTFTIK